MSYETTNYLPKGVSKRHATEFAELLGYHRQGTYAHLGSPETVSLVYYEVKDYRSWQPVELSIGVSPERGAVDVHTRTRIGRSHHDFTMQNWTVREFRRRFGGSAVKDGGNGGGYDPGPPVPPAASGCYLAMQGLDWNLTKVNLYIHQGFVVPANNGFQPLEKIWPQMRELNPEVFVSNVLLTYLVSALEEYFKSTYIAILTYSDRKESILKGARLSGEQLARISVGTLTVEEAVAETLPFQRLAAIGRNFLGIDQKLDVLAPLKRPYRRRKVSLLDRLEHLVTRRHALIHGMQLDTDLDRQKLEAVIHDLTVGISRVYQQITSHFDWPFELPRSSNFSLGPRRKPRAAGSSKVEERPGTSELIDAVGIEPSADAKGQS
jgi:hypothetical protein